MFLVSIVQGVFATPLGTIFGDVTKMPKIKFYRLYGLPALLLIIGLSGCGSPSQSQDTTASGNDAGTPPTDTGTPPTDTGTPPTDTGTPPTDNSPPDSNGCMSDTDKEMLKQINQARSTARQCGSQSFSAAPALAWDCTLAQAALTHSKDMADNNFFSHTGSDGQKPSQRVTNAGYQWRATGENIAAGQDTVSEVMNGWLQSPGHCANIMKSKYTEVGAARYRNDNSDYRIYWTQVFATPR